MNTNKHYRMLRRLIAQVKKETLQVCRDPSCLLIAFMLPMILLFIFGYGLSLDAKHVKVAFVSEESSSVVDSLRRSFRATDYIDPVNYAQRRNAEEALVGGRVRGIIVLQNDFTKRFQSRGGITVQLLTDGVETNTATILENYTSGVLAQWAVQQQYDRGLEHTAPVEIKMRVLFNPELESRNSLVPASVVLIMSIIGTLLTSLVVAREWERGTMEAMLSTPISPAEMIAGKLVPYYILGICSTGVCIFVSFFLFHVPFRGSAAALFLISSIFLSAALALGFLVSTMTKNQFLASMLALMLSFLPNMMLSGAIFEIAAMPLPIQLLTYIFPSRYYVTCLQTIFMTGDVWQLFLPNIAVMTLITLFLFSATYIKTPARLE